MALLDQLLMEGVRNYSPEIKPWNASGFFTNAAQVGNLAEKKAELQRQNSLRNLISQRESEGIPFDRLANEAAKYDLQKAISMQDAGQKSLTFNRQELDARLASHKKTMAGWLGGVVLRRAQEAVAEGNAKWDFDYVVNVCNEAASVIFPYDPQTAMSLMSFGKQGLAKKATTPEKKKELKPVDLLQSATTLRTNAGQFSSVTSPREYYGINNGANAADAVARLEEERRVYATKNDVNRLWALAGPDRFKKTFSVDDYLRIAREMDSNGKSFHLYNEDIESRNPEDNDQVIGDNFASEIANAPSAQDVPAASSKSVVKNDKPSSAEEGNIRFDNMITLSGNTPILREDGGVFNRNLEKANTIKDLENLKTKLTNEVSKYGSQKSTGGVTSEGTYKNLFDQIDKKIKSLQDIEDSFGSNTPATRLMSKAASKRYGNIESRALRQLGTFAEGMVSNTPLSVVGIGLGAQSPDYALTQAQMDAAQFLAKTGNVSDEFVSAFSGSGSNTINNYLKIKNAYKLLEAIGLDNIKLAKTIYKSYMAECKTPEEKKQVDAVLRSTFRWPEHLLLAVKTNKSNLGTAEELEKRSLEQAKDVGSGISFYTNGVQLPDGTRMSTKEFNKYLESHPELLEEVQNNEVSMPIVVGNSVEVDDGEMTEADLRAFLNGGKK